MWASLGGVGGWGVIILPTTGMDDSDEVCKDHIMDGRPCVAATRSNKVLVFFPSLD